MSIASRLDRKYSGRTEGETMSEVRVLVGTRKGAFVLTSDGTRKRWDIANWSAIARDLPPVLSVDLSHERRDATLPDMVAKGAEPFLVVGAMAGR